MKNFVLTSVLIHVLVWVFLMIAFITHGAGINQLITVPILVLLAWVVATIFIFVLARSDPGIIRKQIPKYEYDKDLAAVPVDSRALY